MERAAQKFPEQAWGNFEFKLEICQISNSKNIEFKSKKRPGSNATFSSKEFWVSTNVTKTY